MPFRLYLIYLIRLVYCICSDILPHSLKLLHHLSIRVYLAFNASYFISILYVSFCPHGYEGLICSWIDMYICTYIQYFFVFSRLKLVAEERMVQGLWLHRPAVLPLGVLRRVLGSLLEEEQRRLQLRSLNRLRPLLRHAPPALRLVSRFPIPHYLLRTLG